MEIVFKAIKGCPPSIEWLPLGSIKVDEKYQRTIETPPSQRLIKEIACNWDWRLFSPISVSRREDGLFVMDGQHRLEAAKMRGDIPHLPAVVARFDSIEEEAQAFVSINTARKSPTQLDKFNARCIAGDPNALEISGIVAEAGLKIGRNPYSVKDGEICCIATLTRTHRQYGGKILSGALINMVEAFPGEGLRCGNEMIPGICMILLKPPADWDVDLFVEVLSSRQQSHWFAQGWSEHNSDPESEYPDEVFRDVLLAAYLERIEKRQKVGNV